ncbi:MAG: ATP-grasp domain-containing protein [Candidatus Heimdallarchaeota archaeon]
MEETRILVLGSCGPPGANFIKSLKITEHPYYVVGSDSNSYHAIGLSPQSDVTYLIPLVKKPDALIDRINAIIDFEKVEFVHPQPDVLVRFVSDHRDRIKARSSLPSKKTVDICQNKWESAKKWLDSGIPCPQTVSVSSIGELDAGLDEISYPCWVRATTGAGGRGSSLVANRETVEAWMRYWESRTEKMDFILQEYLPGRNVACQTLWSDGEIISCLARTRLEYIYPFLAVSGVTGTPVVAKNLHLSKNEQKLIQDIVLSVDENATGLFCIDLKADKKGELNPTEINTGRFFTTSAGFALLGKFLGKWVGNTPHLYVQQALEKPIPKVSQFNGLPEDWYYIRHIDVGSYWIPEEDLSIFKEQGKVSNQKAYENFRIQNA